MAFGSGSSVIMPLKNEAGMPLNGLEVAQNVAEVLAYDPAVRYIGMAVYCIDEQATYRFKNGVTDDDFVVDNEGTAETGMTIVEDYSQLPTTTTEEMAYCKNAYDDGTTTYPSGFYAYNVDNAVWELVSTRARVETDSEEDNTFIENVEIENVEENIQATKFTQIVGREETIIITANQDSTDGTTIKAGDIISITKTIDGIEVFSYNILNNEEDIYNPFI